MPSIYKQQFVLDNVGANSALVQVMNVTSPNSFVAGVDSLSNATEACTYISLVLAHLMIVLIVAVVVVVVVTVVVADVAIVVSYLYFAQLRFLLLLQTVYAYLWGQNEQLVRALQSVHKYAQPFPGPASQLPPAFSAAALATTLHTIPANYNPIEVK